VLERSGLDVGISRAPSSPGSCAGARSRAHQRERQAPPLACERATRFFVRGACPGLDHAPSYGTPGTGSGLRTSPSPPRRPLPRPTRVHRASGSSATRCCGAQTPPPIHAIRDPEHRPTPVPTRAWPLLRSTPPPLLERVIDSPRRCIPVSPRDPRGLEGRGRRDAKKVAFLQDVINSFTPQLGAVPWSHRGVAHERTCRPVQL